jgi:hypothetical protein
MSPRAACRLEAAGFGPVSDYVAGKGDWLAANLPFEGTARLAGMFTRRGVATTGERAPAAEALRLLDAQGFGPILVLNEAGAVMGAAYRDTLAAAGTDAEVGAVMRFGVSTVRPSEDAGAGAPDGPRRGDPGGGDPFGRHAGRAVLRRRRDLVTSRRGLRAPSAHPVNCGNLVTDRLARSAGQSGLRQDAVWRKRIDPHRHMPIEVAITG